MTVFDTNALIVASMLVDESRLVVGSREEKSADRRVRQQEISKLEEQWQGWLASEYASDFNLAASSIIFSEAWAEGHADGYDAVESHYNDLAEFVRRIKVTE